MRLGVLIFAMLYLVSGTLGLWLNPLPEHNVTPFWPATGVALPLVLTYGPKYSPVISLCAFTLAISKGMSLVTAFGFAAANSIVAIVATVFLKSGDNSPFCLGRLGIAVRFVVLGALFPTAIGAVIEVLGLCIGGSLEPSQAWSSWWAWWLADTSGALLIAPFVLMWQSPSERPWDHKTIVEAITLVLLLALSGTGVFGGWLATPANQPPEYLFFPFLVWASLRLGQRGATLITFMSALVVIVSWRLAVGPVPSPTDLDVLLKLETFLCVLAVTGMLLAAIEEERNRAEQIARSRADGLARAIVFCTESEGDFNDYLGHVLTEIVRAVTGIGGFLWLPDFGSDSVRLCLTYGKGRLSKMDHPRVTGMSCPQAYQDHSRCLTPMGTCNGVFLSASDDLLPGSLPVYLQQIGAKAVLVLPACIGKQTIGWINVFLPDLVRTDREAILPFAETIARQAALAIQLAELRERAQTSAALEERSRIARDLHDTLAQSLVAIIMQLRVAKRALQADVRDLVGPSKAVPHLDRALDFAQAGVNDVRSSVGALRERPAVFEPFRSRMEALVKKLTDGSGLEASVTATGTAYTLPEATEVELGRIVQEALSNALRHAQAKRIQVRLMYSSIRFELIVDDDGVGFQQESPTDGYGLLGMRERAERIGARLGIETVMSKGTRIRVELMLAQENTSHEALEGQSAYGEAM